MFRTQLLKKIANVTVIGAGTMGGGIAQVTAQAGLAVTVVDNQAALNKGNATISKSVARVAKKKFADSEAKQQEYVASVMANIAFVEDAQKGVAAADLVVEAITEKIEAKKGLWASIDGAAPKTAIFATNTSSLSVTEQATAAPSRAELFAGLHFFSPVAMMKLVEIVKGDATNDQAVADLKVFVEKISKESAICSDTKGFIVNRLLVPYLLEAARLVERGVASVEDVDVAMKLGAGHPMGPFTLADSIGLDVINDISNGWAKAEPENPAFTPSKLIADKVAAGQLGRKSGKGFYDYTK